MLDHDTFDNNDEMGFTFRYAQYQNKSAHMTLCDVSKVHFLSFTEYTCTKYKCCDDKLKRSLGTMLRKIGSKRSTSTADEEPTGE